MQTDEFIILPNYHPYGVNIAIFRQMHVFKYIFPEKNPVGVELW